MSESLHETPTPAPRSPNPPADAAPSPGEKLATRLHMIFEVGRASLSKLDMGELLNTAAEAIHRHFGYYDVSIFLTDPEAAECVLVARAGLSSIDLGMRGYRQKLSVGVVGWVAEHGETALVNDVRVDPRRVVAFDGQETLLSELAVPIRLHGRTVGVINVEKREVNAFDECDVVALETLSDQIAQAVANAQLFEQTRLLLDLNRGIINAMPSGLCVLDGEMKVLFISPAFCDLIGCEGEPAKGRDVHEVIPPALLVDTGVEQAIIAALTQPQGRLFPDVLLRRSQGDRLLKIHVTPAQMPEGLGVLLIVEDVTELRKTAALAEERRSLLDLIVTHVPVAVVSCDMEGRFTFWGSGAQRLFGYDETEALGRMTPLDLTASRQELRPLLARCQGEGSAEGEAIVRHKNGATLPALFVLGKLMDRAGRPAGYTAVIVDITERRRAAEELLREKMKLEHVVGVIGAGLALIDRNHRVIWSNPKIQEWFGHEPALEGKTCHDIFCHRERECGDCPARRCFATGLNSESDVTLVRADGSMRQFHHAVTPVLGPDGSVDHVLKLTLDVTDQNKKIYQLSRLRQLGELMQGVLELDKLLHFVLTCVTAGQALGFNRAILLLVDKDRNVIEGRMGVGPGSAEEAGRIWSQMSREAPTLESLLDRYTQEAARSPSLMTQIARRITIPLEDRLHIVVECALGRKPITVDDAQRDPRVREDFRRLIGARQFILAPLIARNEPVGVILADNLFSLQPISQDHLELLSMFANQAAIAIANAENYNKIQEEKRHLEQAYRDLADAQDRLVRSERLVAIGRMATHVAHEIRNPLVTVGGFANNILQHPDLPRDTVSRYAQIISNEVRRLENILARVMDFTRPPKPMLREAALNPVIRDTLDQLAGRIKRQNVSVVLDLPEPGPVLNLDPEQMKQVFLNLVQNALDVMRDGGQLGIVARYAEAQATVTVANSGDPIRPDDLSKLFEPFFTTKPGGTGLGLAVTQKIIQDHGGDVRVNPDARQGTEFIITLPRGKAALQAPG